MTAPIRILLVDDQELIRVGFRLVLEAEPDLVVVGEAAEGESAVAHAIRVRPDVILMDVRMPGVDGIAATERIVRAMPDAKVLVLTTFDLDEYAFGAIQAGASGFLLKDAQRGELTRAVRAVHAGDAVLAPRVTRRVLEHVTTRLSAPPGETIRPRASPNESSTSSARWRAGSRTPRSRGAFTWGSPRSRRMWDGCSRRSARATACTP